MTRDISVKMHANVLASKYHKKVYLLCAILVSFNGNITFIYIIYCNLVIHLLK